MALAWEKEETWQRWVLSPVFVLNLNWIWVNVHRLLLNWSIFQVFGDEWWSFCFPVFSSFGDGLTFPQVGFLEVLLVMCTCTIFHNFSAVIWRRGAWAQHDYDTSQAGRARHHHLTWTTSFSCILSHSELEKHNDLWTLIKNSLVSLFRHWCLRFQY